MHLLHKDKLKEFLNQIIKIRSANIKKEILNCVLFWPKKEWKPHSNALSFSWYGLCGANIKLTANKIIANIGINIKKKVVLVI